jgi:hypothetical protein
MDIGFVFTTVFSCFLLLGIIMAVLYYIESTKEQEYIAKMWDNFYENREKKHKKKHNLRLIKNDDKEQEE